MELELEDVVCVDEWGGTRTSGDDGVWVMVNGCKIDDRSYFRYKLIRRESSYIRIMFRFDVIIP